jgi:hypothetical protein
MGEYRGLDSGDIPTSKEMLEEYKADDSPPTSIGLDEVLELEKEYSKWQARNDAWFANKNNPRPTQ